MATLTMRPLMRQSDFSGAFQTFKEFHGYAPSYGDNFTRAFKDKFGAPVIISCRLSRVTRDMDDHSIWFNDMDVRLDTTDPRFEEVRANLPCGFRIVDGNRLVIDYVNQYFVLKAEMDRATRYGGTYYNWERFGLDQGDIAQDAMLRVDMNLEDRGCYVDVQNNNQSNDRFECLIYDHDGITAEIRMTIPNRDTIYVSHSYYGARLPPGSGFWDVIDRYESYYGFYPNRDSGRVASGFLGGLERTFMELINAPDTIYVDLQPGAKNVTRSLIIDGCLEKSAVGRFPVRHRTSVYSFTEHSQPSRRRTSIVRRTTSLDNLISFGLNADQTSFNTFDADKIAKTYPVLERTLSDSPDQLYWELPADRFLFQRSIMGFHGMFILNATVHLTGEFRAAKNTDKCWVAYCVPTFLSHEDARDVPTRFRNLPDDTRDFISETYGLSDFLNQSLMTLQGAKRRMKAMGLDLHGFTTFMGNKKTPEIPKGHLIRSWGTPMQDARYEADEYKGNATSNPYKSRATGLAYRAFKNIIGPGSLAPMMGHRNVQPELQRVAEPPRLRMLEV